MNTLAVYQVFILMGLIIVLSFLSTTFFRWTRIPSSLLLIFVGIFLNYGQDVFSIEVLRSIAPVFGAFALLLVLLEAGLELDMRLFVKSIGPAILFGTVTYFASIIALSWVLKTYFHYELALGLLLALVSVGGSPAILLPIVRGMHINETDKAFTDLECTVTEILGLILTVSAIPILLPTLLPTTPPFKIESLFVFGGYKLFIVFVEALFAPVILGMLWSRVLSKAGDKPLWPMLTIGVALLIYGITELLQGKGALNVFVFALVIGNATAIREFIAALFSKTGYAKQKLKRALNFFVGDHFAQVRHVSLEISFFVRTFFFVYLGAIVEFSSFTLQVCFIVLLLTFLPMAVRYLFSILLSPIKKIHLPPISLSTFLLPRGLANVLAAFAILVYANKINLPTELANSLDEMFIAPVFGVVMISNIILPFFLLFRKETELLETKVETLG